MNSLIYILYVTFNLLLRGYHFLMLVRVICSWIPSCRNSIVFRVSFAATEPVLQPLRDILFRWEFARRCPIDLAFIALYLILEILSRVVNAALLIFLV